MNTPMQDDGTLLLTYCRDHSQAAFTALVHRYIDLVYSAATRQTGGDRQLAEDVAQSVFHDLALKAPLLAGHPVLAGWLYRSTHFAAAKLVRSEQRRRRRELDAMNAEDLNAPAGDEAWASLRPVLDEAMHRLNNTDRDALVLRYFQHQSYSQVASHLRIGENAARMRVERALDKLRAVLVRRGIRSTATALGSVLTTQALSAAPSGLAAAVAVKAGTISSLSGLALVFHSMCYYKLQTTIAAALLFGGVAAVYQQTHAREDAPRATPAAVEAKAAQPPATIIPATETQTARRTRVAADDNAASPSASPVFDLKQLDVRPVLLAPMKIEFPYELKEAGISGEAVIEFVIDVDGRVREADMVTASHVGFVEAALDAVMELRFSPGTKDGLPVKCRVQQPITFTLDKDLPSP